MQRNVQCQTTLQAHSETDVWVLTPIQAGRPQSMQLSSFARLFQESYSVDLHIRTRLSSRLSSANANSSGISRRSSLAPASAARRCSSRKATSPRRPPAPPPPCSNRRNSPSASLAAAASGAHRGRFIRCRRRRPRCPAGAATRCCTDTGALPCCGTSRAVDTRSTSRREV